MKKKLFRGRIYNEVVKSCAGRSSSLGNILYKAANKTYREGFVRGFLIRGPTLLIN